MENPLNKYRELLPPQYKDIAKNCGEEVAFAVCWHMGGLQVSIPGPDKLTDDHQLVRAIGMDLAKKLCHIYRGNILKPPRCVQALRAIRNAEIRQLINAGTKKAIVAQKFTMTERAIELICAKEAAVTNNTDIFDL